MDKVKVLFVCIHNSARSQIAEAFLNDLAGDRFYAESAGLEPGELNPLVVKVMQEIGIDISNNKTDDVFEFFKQGRIYNYVITVCDKSNGERCPLFPGIVQNIEWSFDDPSALIGSFEEKLIKTRMIRDGIKNKIIDFINEYKMNKLSVT